MKTNRSSSFCCIAQMRILLQREGQKDGQMVSNTMVANQLLTAKATNKELC